MGDLGSPPAPPVVVVERMDVSPGAPVGEAGVDAAAAVPAAEALDFRGGMMALVAVLM